MVAITTTKRGSLVGCQYIQAWLVGSDGFAYGTAGEGMAVGSTSHARLLRNPVSAQVPNPARIVTNLKGGNRWLGQVQFGIDTVGNFPMVLEDIDADFFGMAGGSTPDVTSNSRWTQFSDNKNNGELPQLGLMFSTLFQSRADASDGLNLWINYIVPRCQVDVNFAQMAYQAEGQVTCQVSPTMSTKKPTGEALTGLGVKNGRAVMYAIVSPKPLALTTFIQDATETDIVVGYKPTSTIVGASNAANQLTVDGTLTALASMTIATATGVLSVAGTSGKVDEILYETDFEAAA